MASEKTSLNLPANILGAVCYAPFVGWVVSIVVLLLEKNETMRWHAVHGLIISVGFFLLSMILFPLAGLFAVAGLVIQVYAAVKVYQGEKVRFWKVSEWADKAAEKVKM